MASNLNPFVRLQKWMDTFAGQTFMQYAYSWGAAVVILGTLFKLTHIQGANLMLFIGMGTEVFVFFIAAFERVTVKDPEKEQQAECKQTQTEPRQTQEVHAEIYSSVLTEEGGVMPLVMSSDAPQSVYVAPQVNVEPAVRTAMQEGEGTQGVQPNAAINASAGLSAAAASLAAAGQAAASAQLALNQLQNGGNTLNPALTQATDPSVIEEAVKNYATELTELTEVLGRVKLQAARMSTDSEEMENLNRTLTGIATIYELQLKNISKQVSTIEQIDEQTKRMALQIEELNNVYARMIQALTVNMRGATPQAMNE